MTTVWGALASIIIGFFVIGFFVSQLWKVFNYDDPNFSRSLIPNAIDSKQAVT